MTDKERYETLVNTIIDQCIEMDLKARRARLHEDWNALGKYNYKYSALYALIKSQGDEIFMLFYQRSYEAGCYSQEAGGEE